MVAGTSVQRLAHPGKTIFEENNSGFLVKRTAVLGAARKNGWATEMMTPQPVSQRLRASGVVMRAFGFAIRRFVYLDGFFGVKRDAHTDGALVVPRTITGC